MVNHFFFSEVEKWRQSQLKKNVGDMSLVSIISRKRQPKCFSVKKLQQQSMQRFVVPATHGTNQKERDTGEQDQKWESSNNGVARILR